MLKPDLYKRTVAILYDAYFNDTLQHGNCYACAVGNIVAANCGYTYKRGILFQIGWEGVENMYEGYSTILDHNFWAKVFTTNDRNQKIRLEYYHGEPKRQIDSTGYTWQELAKIEYAFETAAKDNSAEDWMFNGLVAVLEVLAQIHQVGKEEATTDKARFQNHYSTKTADCHA